MDEETRKKFRDRVRVMPGGCWLWQGAKHPKGYGMFYAGGRTVYAHRWLWQYVRGEIPPKMEIHHRCKNRNCVRVDHLEMLTHRQNMKEAGRRGAWAGEKNPQSRRTDQEVREMKALYRIGTPIKRLAAIYGVSLRSAYYYVRAWRHLDRDGSTGKKRAA